jgi:phospholipid N-methyltransferase
MNTQEILKECTIDGLVIRLPDIKLDRKEYLDVKKSLELIGGKWKGGKVSGFVFKEDPSDLLQSVSSGEKRNLKKEFQFFPTPQDLAEKMVHLADVKNHHSILEPSAGQGAIINEIISVSDVQPAIYELMDLNVDILEKKGLCVNLIGRDYMKDNDGAQYDRIIANPPFAKNQDIDHIMKMFENCKNGGRIVTLSSRHWQHSQNKKETAFREFLESVDCEIEEIESGAFKESGTNISTLLLIINK